MVTKQIMQKQIDVMFWSGLTADSMPILCVVCLKGRKWKVHAAGLKWRKVGLSRWNHWNLPWFSCVLYFAGLEWIWLFHGTQRMLSCVTFTSGKLSFTFTRSDSDFIFHWPKRNENTHLGREFELNCRSTISNPPPHTTLRRSLMLEPKFFNWNLFHFIKSGIIDGVQF